MRPNNRWRNRESHSDVPKDPVERKPVEKKMAKEKKNAGGQEATMVSRRGFFRKSRAAGIGGAAALAGVSATSAEAAIHWDREADVVVLGSGASGMPAAVAARDQGVSVIVVEKNFDVGGRGILSGGQVQLGCGNPLQAAAGVKDSPDQFFLDWTGSEGEFPVDRERWGQFGNPLSRWNDRELIRAFADNAVDTYHFLVDHGVIFTRASGTRGPGDPQGMRNLTTKPWQIDSERIVGTAGGPGGNDGWGSGLIRPLEKSARAKGVQFLLLHRMTQIHRETPTSGRVLGITAVEVDKWNKPTGKSVNIRARKGVIVATGGHNGNVNFRRMYDPALTEEYTTWGAPYTTKDADGELAAMAIGASLWTLSSQTNGGERQYDRPGSSIGTRYNGSPKFLPTSPAFFRIGSTGLNVRDWQNAIMVKENGRRFYEETLRGKPLGSPGWRESVAAATRWSGDPGRLNGGGPIWAIFDAEAAKRENWTLDLPWVDKKGGYFFEADTLEELAGKVKACPYQWRAMPGESLRATVTRYNSFVDAGVDSDYAKPTPTHKIGTPPFYAAWATPPLHDVMSGLRVNVNAQVMDMHGQVIPGLYAAGESGSAISMHGLAKGAVFGRLAALHAAKQQA
jgi:succinate dehydrogenase/fumarate reductase flavoprotein subunit